MSVLFVSDVHLSSARRRMVETFLDFLAGPARAAERLYVLGDLFDIWLGDDDGREPHEEVAAALGELTRRGTPVGVMHGNHDFLLGPEFARRTGCTLLEEPARAELGGAPVLLLHGDVLCTRDEDYQAFRRWSRDPEVQRDFLSLPFEQRMAKAAELSQLSRQVTRLMPDDIMDVTPDAVESLLRERDARCLIHGHTHRPAIHEWEMDGATARRIVLGDWYEHHSVLAWDGNGFALTRIDELPHP